LKLHKGVKVGEREKADAAIDGSATIIIEHFTDKVRIEHKDIGAPQAGCASNDLGEGEPVVDDAVPCILEKTQPVR